jgi:hypothetical protein
MCEYVDICSRGYTLVYDGAFDEYAETSYNFRKRNGLPEKLIRRKSAWRPILKVCDQTKVQTRQNPIVYLKFAEQVCHNATSIDSRWMTSFRV